MVGRRLLFPAAREQEWPMVTATTSSTQGRPAVSGGSVASALAVEWRELGGLGRLASAGLVLSAVVAVGLGLWIEASVKRHLLDVRAEVLQDIVDDMVADGLLPLAGGSPSADAVAAAIARRVIGGEIAEVSLRDPTGEVVYGDPGPHDGLEDAPAVTVPHVEQHSDGLLHYRLPVASPQGAIAGTFEVFQQPGSFHEILSRVRRNLWAAIVAGLGSLGIAMGAFTLAHARTLDHRRRHAETLLGELLQAEDLERRRIVASLHDDIGQPLYRVLYGLEGCRAGLEADTERASELERLGGLLRDVDQTLRNEMHHLHRSTLDPLDLLSALEAVAQECRDETDLDVEVTVDTFGEPPPVARSVLLRAVEEALANVRRHAAANQVRIRVTDDGGYLLLEVVDDGKGYNGVRDLGLTTLSGRLEAIGGRLTIRPGRDGGTVLRAWAPHEAEVPS
jgi:signal transduction histidine kinase